MAGKIVRLPEDLTNKIAAGEVVERPASILKELLENSLDAGAADVTIELTGGGCRSIKIADNGEGMDNDDVPKAFERYATSKIFTFDDIYQVKSFGFRGEALPSIASISRVEIISRRKNSLTGAKITVENGKVVGSSEIGCAPGTSIFVDRIFDAVPVRKKFLKSEGTEQGYCMEVITRLALANPCVRMRVLAKGKTILSVPAARNDAERISLILGVDFIENSLPVSASFDQLRIRGFVSKPNITRSSNKQIYYYVNNRFIRDYLINHAVMTAYARIIEARRYPLAVLFLEMDPSAVDVNVHPAKMEVRFRNPRDIYSAVYQAVADVLVKTAPLTDSSSIGAKFQTRMMGPDNYQSRMEEAVRRYTVSSGTKKIFYDRSWSFEERKNGLSRSLLQPPDIAAEPDAKSQIVQKETVKYTDLHYIGQAGDVYLIFQSPAGLLLVDQHAAHERVLYEKLREQSGREAMRSQRLLIPEVINLTPKDYTFLMQERDAFSLAGVEFEPFGQQQIAIKAVPADLADISGKDLIQDMLEEFSEREIIGAIKDKLDKIYAVMACKGAVKAHQTLSPEEVSSLCRALDDAPFAATCPHGRPVFVSLSFADLEKMFKRR